MAGKGSGGVLGAVAKIVSLVLVAAMLGAVIWYAIATNGFSDFDRVQYGDTVLTKTTTNVTLLAGEKNEFRIENLNFTTNDPTYTIEIYLNSEEPFTYTMNGDGESYSSLGIEENIAEYFEPEITESGFTLSPPKESYKLVSLLAWLYPDATDLALSSATDSEADQYLLVLTFSNNTAYNVYFHVSEISLSLDKDNIIFGGGDTIVTEPGDYTDEDEGEDEGQGSEEQQQEYEISYDYLSLGANGFLSFNCSHSVAAAGTVIVFSVSSDDSVAYISRIAVERVTDAEVIAEWTSSDSDLYRLTEKSLSFEMPEDDVVVMIYYIENSSN